MVLAKLYSNISKKIDKSGGRFTGGVDFSSNLLKFYVGGKIGFALRNDGEGHLCFYNHDLLLLAYLDSNGNLYTRGTVTQKSMG